MEYECRLPYPGNRHLVVPWDAHPQTISVKVSLYFPNVIKDIESRIMKIEGMQ